MGYDNRELLDSSCKTQKNSSDTNPIKEEFPVSNLYVYIFVQIDGKIERKTRLI